MEVWSYDMANYQTTLTACLGLTRFHQQDAQHVCKKKDSEVKLLLRVYCKLCVGKLLLKSEIKFS